MGRIKIVRDYPEEMLWIQKNKAFLSLNKIEEKIGLPKQTLWKFCDGSLGINERWWPKIVEFVRAVRA